MTARKPTPPHPRTLAPPRWQADDLLTIPEVAEWWRVAPDTVAEAIRRGEIRAQRIGRLWRVRFADATQVVGPDRGGAS